MRGKKLITLFACASLSVSAFLTCGPTKPAENTPTPKFIFKAKSNPLPGFESYVDAVTKASDVIDTLFVRIDSLPATDSLKTVIVEWGDSTQKVVPGNVYPMGLTFGAFTHWYIRTDTVTGICTTKATATTYGGITLDTSIRIRILAKGAH